MNKREQVIAAMERAIHLLTKDLDKVAAEDVAKSVWLEVEEVLEIWRAR